ncbi:metallophosphoesterase [Alkaliflexus imshenetskii]|uniref:metallophosphoesterase n=1 Tax=Alkaliflexus imshenetskii TaxID=286730 RepID=UPI0004B7C073|nr:metallophosphoesterase [Alkaliflexus imshenetskii]
MRRFFSALIQNFSAHLKPVISEPVDGLYDIIGDIHGYPDELKALLVKLGYGQEKGYWSHPQRRAIFVGDFVSRGPGTRDVLLIIRNMVENDAALAVLGNHELNVIGHFTINSKGKPIAQLAPSNIAQMDRISDQFRGEEEVLADTVKWLRRLPFFIDLGHLRVVHAYWSDENRYEIEQTMTKNKLTKSLVKEIFKGESLFAKAVWQTTRGIEINLPKDLIIKDEKGVQRTNFRIKWWENPHGKTFRSISYGNRFRLPDYTVPEQILFPFEIYDASKPLVFIGHYCALSEPLITASNVCCTDSCLAGPGRLAAYRYQGEKELWHEYFVFQDRFIRK